MALFDGKFDAIDFMAIEWQGRRDKLNQIVQTVRESDEETFDITPLCHKLDIKLTSNEVKWILEQLQDN